METLSARAHILQDELAACDAWEQQSQAQALANAKAAAEAAEQKLSLLRQRLEADRVPEVDTIGRLPGRHCQSGNRAEKFGEGPV